MNTHHSAVENLGTLYLIESRLTRTNKREETDYRVADAIEAFGNIWLARAADDEESLTNSGCTEVPDLQANVTSPR